MHCRQCRERRCGEQQAGLVVLGGRGRMRQRAKHWAGRAVRMTTTMMMAGGTGCGSGYDPTPQPVFSRDPGTAGERLRGRSSVTTCVRLCVCEEPPCVNRKKSCVRVRAWCICLSPKCTREVGAVVNVALTSFGVATVVRLYTATVCWPVEADGKREETIIMRRRNIRRYCFFTLASID